MTIIKADANRTLARSRQIDAEETGSNRRPATSNADSFSDDPEEQGAVATLLRDDRIDFLDHQSANEYRDDFTDDDDVFKYGDGDEEGAIGLDKQPSQR